MVNNIVDMAAVCGALVALAFLVSALVQLTKNFIPLPTKAWVIIVSLFTVTMVLAAVINIGIVKITVANAILAFFGSLLVAYIAMYGFDTLKELWDRLSGGGGGIDDK